MVRRSAFRRTRFPTALRRGLAAILLLALAGCAGSPAPESRVLPDDDAALADFLSEQVAIYQKQLAAGPQHPGVEVRVAAYDTVLELTFRYRKEARERATAIARYTNAALLKQGCDDTRRRHWMDRGVTFRFTYRDRDNGLVLRSDLDSAFCDLPPSQRESQTS